MIVKNFAKFNFSEIQAAFANVEMQNLYQNWQAAGVSTDSRSIEQDNLFFALKGERFDGHEHVADAIGKGAAAAVVSNQWIKMNKNSLNLPLIIVPDTLKALGELAFIHRIKFDFPIVAIAGSNGKTTTKELAAAVLSQKFNVIKTLKNFNNQIGVPMAIFQFDEKTEAAVIEIGTNSPGEIAILANILQPNFGLITNIGKEHLEELIDLDNVEIEETLLFGVLNNYSGICLINNDDERLKKYTQVISKYITYATNNEADFRVNIQMNDSLQSILSFSVDSESVVANSNLIGIAAGLNAAAAITIGYALGLSANEIKLGIESYKPEENNGYARMELFENENLLILNDCYNANPTSMEMSIQTLALCKTAKLRLAILGDMFELGTSSHEEHVKILNYACDMLDEVWIIGDNMHMAAENINSRKIKKYSFFTDIAKHLCNISNQYSVDTIAVLLKGSRGMRMEQLLTLL